MYTVFLFGVTILGCNIISPTRATALTASPLLELEPATGNDFSFEEPTETAISCRSCREGCQAYDLNRDGGLCKCDTDCEAYGDCCGPSASRKPDVCEQVPTDTNLNGLEFTCQSIFLNSKIAVMKHEAFWMVSRCPADWLDEVGESGQMVLDGCESSSRDLPPVTNRVTGVVYKNQHCALCNRVEDTLSWEANLVCTQYLYDLFETTPISEIDQNLFQEQCQPCSYQPPNSVRSPRACYPTVDTCRVDESQYSNECVNGSYDLHASYVPDVFDGSETVFRIYRNRECANCNGEKSRCLTETLRTVNTVPLQCVPNIPPPTSEAPPTTTTEIEFVMPTTLPVFPFEPPPNPLEPPPDPLEPPPNPLVPLLPQPDIDDRINGITGIERPPPTNQGIPFTITLSNLGGGQVSVRTETETLNVTVDCPEGQAPVGLECRDTICPQGFVSVDGRCFSQQSPRVSDDRNQSTNASDGFFLDCPTELVPLNDTEFTQLSNNTVQLVDGEVKDILGYSEDGQPLICPDNTTTIEVNSTLFSYPAGFLELTYIGCSLSVIGSSMVLITYGLFKELRTLPSKILMNLAFANLVTNLLILIGGPVSQAFPIIQLCTAVAICLHFFFLAQFAWMSVMSFEVVRKFRRAKDLIMDSKRDKLRLLLVYLLFGWGLPLLITTVAIIVNFTKSEFVLYGVLADGSLGSCWINHFESAVIAFVAPLILSVSFNLIMFIVTTVYICMASRAQTKLKKDDNTPFFHLNIAIFCTTGLTWIFGFIAILAGTSWAWYLFIIFNSTQGFVIFVAFLFTKKTLNLYIACLTCKKLEKTSKSSSASTSQTNTVVSRAGTTRNGRQNSVDNITVP